MKEVTDERNHLVVIAVVDNAKLRLVQRNSIITERIEQFHIGSATIENVDTIDERTSK